MSDKTLVSKIVESFKKAEAARAQHESQWENNYRLYKTKLKQISKGKANLFIPYTWATVEQLKAKTQLALFTKKPYVSYAGQEAMDVDGATLMEDLIYYQMKDKVKLPEKMLNALTSIYVYGTSVALYSWKTEEKKIRKLKKIMDRDIVMGEEEVEDLQVLYDDPDIEFLSIDDIYPDPEGDNVETCSFIITRAFKDMKYLESMEKQGIYELPEIDLLKNDEYEAAQDFRMSVDNISYENEDRNKKYELISHYTDDEIIVVLNRKHIIRQEKNPLYCGKKPFIRGVAYPQEKCFWGDSVVRILESLQEELNATRNQRIDNVSAILNKPMLVNSNDDELMDHVENGELPMYAGAVYESRDPNNAVRPFDIPDVTGSAYQEEQIIKQDMQYVSAINEYSRGGTPSRKDTATAVTAFQEASNAVFNYVITVIEQSLLLPIGEAMKQLNQQYMDQEKTVRLFNKSTGNYDYQSVDPESIAGAYDVTSVSPRFEAEQTKEAKRGQMIETFNLILNNPLTQQYINPFEFTKKLLEMYDIKDFDKFLIDPQQQQEEMQQDPLQQDPLQQDQQGALPIDPDEAAAYIASLPPDQQQAALMQLGSEMNV